MRIHIIDIIQHLNAAIMLVFCIFYPLSYFSRYFAELGVVIWAFALPFIYFPDLVHIPGVSKEEMRGTKKASIIGGWFWVVFWIGDLVDNKLMRIVSGVLVIFLLIYTIYYIRKFKKMQEKGQ
jgi:succinate dehydrogenase hydrophobic anchor subunit